MDQSTLPTKPSRKYINPIRLTLGLLALILLLAILISPNLGVATRAEEGESPCMDGCIRGEQNCTGACGYNQSCVNNCRKEYDKCGQL